MFLYIVPLKQGLKHCGWKIHGRVGTMFLYIDPLKQGLKLKAGLGGAGTARRVFIHRSIKTRIETITDFYINTDVTLFLYIDPLKQGLKLFCRTDITTSIYCFYT